MSLGHIVRVHPSKIRFTLLGAGDEVAGILGGDYDLPRALFERDVKHRSVRQRYVEHKRWEDTDLFTDIYRRRFSAGGMVRGAWSMDELVRQYYTRVDAMFADMKRHGFRLQVGGRPVPLPNLHVGHDGELLLGNNGNHRLAMAQIIGLKTIECKIQSMHELAPPIVYDPKGKAITDIIPPTSDAIPAMTTFAERQSYYALAREAAPVGHVIEMGAWLGASTVYIAAGVRDSGATRKVDVYDRFRWDDAHAKKVSDWSKEHPKDGYVNGHAPTGGMLEAFKTNLGDLLGYVEPHVGEIKNAEWSGGKIALMILDAPKRVKDIARVLKTFAPHMPVGARMAWQDFAHFPSYEIVACMARLEEWATFDYGVAPGTTAIFTVQKRWQELEPKFYDEMLALQTWDAEEVTKVWERWAKRLPEHMRARFRCGAALFLCDLGRVIEARETLREVLKDNAAEVMPKWNYMRQHRSDLASRYSKLFTELPA